MVTTSLRAPFSLCFRISALAAAVGGDEEEEVASLGGGDDEDVWRAVGGEDAAEIVARRPVASWLGDSAFLLLVFSFCSFGSWRAAFLGAPLGDNPILSIFSLAL